MGRNGAFKSSKDPRNATVVGILLFIRKPANKAPCLSTYTVLDVEVSAICNQESDHLVPIQPHCIMQGGISFLENRVNRLKVGLRPGSGSRKGAQQG